MAGNIEVRIGGRGSVRDGVPSASASQRALCDLCKQESDAVASTGFEASGPFACKTCLRKRLEAMTVGSYLLRETGDAGLPWGKVSG